MFFINRPDTWKQFCFYNSGYKVLKNWMRPSIATGMFQNIQEVAIRLLYHLVCAAMPGLSRYRMLSNQRSCGFIVIQRLACCRLNI